MQKYRLYSQGYSGNRIYLVEILNMECEMTTTNPSLAREYSLEDIPQLKHLFLEEVHEKVKPKFKVLIDGFTVRSELRAKPKVSIVEY